MIDLHCHILPNVDDGARSLEESLSMAKQAVEDGIHSIVATPHTLNGIYLNRVREITSKVAALQNALSENHIELKLYAGAEVHLCPGMVQRIEAGDAGTIDQAGKYVLLELPSPMPPEGVKKEIFALKLKGITPIITHAERNADILREPAILHGFIRMGALSQVTAMSITGDFGEAAKNAAEKLLQQRLAHIIASDAHSPDHRPPILSHAVEHAAEILGSFEEAERMVTEVPAAILAGQTPDIPEPKEEKGHIFRRIFQQSLHIL